MLLQRYELGVGERGRVLYGLRGVGKTVLLNEFQAMAEARHWVTAKVEASAGRSILPTLAQALHRSLRSATGRFERGKLLGLLQVFRAFSLRMDPDGSYPFGFDVQGADPLPLVVVGAGLPSLPEVLAKATSYAERLYEYVPIGALDLASTHEALVVPAESLGVSWEPEALSRVDDFSHGYPYLIQTGGKYAWDYAATSPITAEDADAGLVQARREVDAGLYRARWQRATPLQRQIMRAMADLSADEPTSMAQVAEVLGRERNELSVPRDQLIKKGLVYAPDRGLIAFTVPGMADYARRQPD